MIESFAVISGSIKDDTNIKLITNVAKERYAEYTTAHHEWINKVEPSDYRNALDSVRNDPEIYAKINARFPNSTIKTASEVDEIYWAVSPKGAVGSDRSLVDCHYDSPFALFPTGGVIFYRVIIACNENNTVTTVFPDENTKVKMGPKDFHGLDYNKDIHCVEGEIPEGKFRILLKLHYIVIPEGKEMYEPWVRWLNVSWTVLSREAMRMSANPQNIWESFVALVVNVCRVIYNNFYIALVFIVLLFGIYMFIPKNKRNRSLFYTKLFTTS
jgi:hypothetical protein